MHMNYDTTSVNWRVCSAERKAFYHRFSLAIWHRFWFQATGLTVLNIVQIVFLALVLPRAFGQVSAQWVTPLVATTGVIVVTITLYYLQKMIDTRVKLWRFAAMNGLDYTAVVSQRLFNGTPFQLRDVRVYDAVQDRAHRLHWLVARGEFSLEQSSRRTVIARHFVELTLPRRVPHMVLIGHGHVYSAANVLPSTTTLAASQRLRLEGSFDNHFTLLCPKEYERDALQIFTPDLMERLMQVAKGCDVELTGDKIYIYTRMLRLDNAKAMDALLGAVEFMADKLLRQTGRYQDERVSHRDQGAKGAIASEGQALREAFDPWPLVQIGLGIGSLALIVAATQVV